MEPTSALQHVTSTSHSTGESRLFHIYWGFASSAGGARLSCSSSSAIAHVGAFASCHNWSWMLHT